MTSSTISFVITLAIMCSIGACALSCPNMSFYDRSSGACIPCSTCGSDQVILRQCYGDFDTKCGPMPHFDFPSKVGPGDDSVPTSSENKQQTETTLVITDSETGDKWFTITLILAVVLVITCISIVVAVLVFCVAYKQKQKHRDILCEPACSDPLTNDYPRMEQFTLVTEKET